MGTSAVNFVFETKTTCLDFVLPKLTVAPFWKFSPLIVVEMPLVVIPVVGLIDATTGASDV